MDKSKRDFLSKLVVVLQTSWFVVQCFARWRSDLPLAELEVSTLAFAILNATVYGIWWNKPQGVLVAIKIPLRRPPPPQHTTGDANNDPPTPPPCSASPESPDLGNDWRGSMEECTCIGQKFEKEEEEEKLFDKRSCNFPFAWFRLNYHKNVGEKASVTGSFIVKLILFYIPSYLLFAPARPTGKLVRNIVSATRDGKDRFRVSATRVPMFYAEDMGLDFKTYLLGVAIPSLVMGVIFGGLHLTIWSCFTPKEPERLLWRSSGLITTGQPFIALVLVLAAHSIAKADKGTMKNSMKVVCATVFASSALLYTAARVILLYLSFCTLTTLEDRVHCDIDWVALAPHVF